MCLMILIRVQNQDFTFVFFVIVFFKLAREKPELLRKKVIFLSCNYYFIKLERD